ncbi:hypothetical protein FN846DRAFT_994056 [Sphaerosporella brunnea]|uniref:Uncharacterized protein n=1 Tax=Sphaerosporella brunnea TaxID=1250544 RepID=A0A5J5ENF3_9PEZI|nr:hypothetical protein FN846DRAFT_994056 [Sphaerosporella brunnea]
MLPPFRSLQAAYRAHRKRVTPIKPSVTKRSAATKRPAAKQSVAEPSVAAPSVAEPSVAAPSVAEPSVAAPSVAEPSVAAPSVAEPSVAAPSVAEPSVAKLSVAEPSAERRARLSKADKLHAFSFRHVTARPGPWRNLLCSSSPVLPSILPSASPSESEDEWGGIVDDDAGDAVSAESAENAEDAENAESTEDAEDAEEDERVETVEFLPSRTVLQRSRENTEKIAQLSEENRLLLAGRGLSPTALPVKGMRSKSEGRYPPCSRPKVGVLPLERVKAEIQEVRAQTQMCEAKIVGLYLLGRVKLGGGIGMVQPRRPVCERCKRKGLACLEVDRSKEKRVFTSSCAECKVAASGCRFSEA